MQLSMRDGLGLRKLPPRFTRFADHGANSRPRVNTRPMVEPDGVGRRSLVSVSRCLPGQGGRDWLLARSHLSPNVLGLTRQFDATNKSDSRILESRIVTNVQAALTIRHWVHARIRVAAPSSGRASRPADCERRDQRQGVKRGGGWLMTRPSSIESCIVAHDGLRHRADASVFPRRRTGGRAGSTRSMAHQIVEPSNNQSALTMSSTTFLASPNTIIVLSM